MQADRKKLRDVRKWLANLRACAISSNFSYCDFFVIHEHAYSCKCRLFSQKVLSRLLCDPVHKPHVYRDVSTSSEPDRFEILVDDLTPELGADRKKCKLIISFDENSGLFIIISAWRTNSPNPNYDDCPRCLYDPAAESCPMEAERTQQKRPRSQI